jgi:hypothetical protein
MFATLEWGFIFFIPAVINCLFLYLTAVLSFRGVSLTLVTLRRKESVLAVIVVTFACLCAFLGLLVILVSLVTDFIQTFIRD